MRCTLGVLGASSLKSQSRWLTVAVFFARDGNYNNAVVEGEKLWQVKLSSSESCHIITAIQLRDCLGLQLGTDTVFRAGI